MPPKRKRFSQRAKECSPARKLRPDSALSMKNLPFPKTGWSYSESTRSFCRGVLTDRYWSKVFDKKVVRIKSNKQAKLFIEHYELLNDEEKALSFLPEYAYYFQDKSVVREQYHVMKTLEVRVDNLEEQLAHERKKTNKFIMMSRNLAVYPELFGSGAVYDSFLVSDRPFKPFTPVEPCCKKGEKVNPGETDDVSKGENIASNSSKEN